MSNLNSTLELEYQNIAQIRKVGADKYEIDVSCYDVEFITLYDKVLLSDRIDIIGGGFELSFTDAQPLAINMSASILRIQAKSHRREHDEENGKTKEAQA